MNVKDIITLCIAIYGALLSTILLIRTILKDRKRVLVTIMHAIGLPEGEFISVRVSNAGTRPVTLNQPSLKIDTGRKKPPRWLIPFGLQQPNDFPKTLKEGESATTLFPLRGVQEEISKHGITREITAEVTDQLEKKYASRKAIRIPG